MVGSLTEERIARFRSQLQHRLDQLQEGVREEKLRSDSEHFADLAGEVHDTEEESVAHLMVDLDLATIERHVHELDALEAALLRIAQGNYGLCVDCELPIPIARLEANPAAERCLNCQQEFERASALEQPSTSAKPSL